MPPKKPSKSTKRHATASEKLASSKRRLAKSPHYFIDNGCIEIGLAFGEAEKRARSLNEEDSLADMYELNLAHTLLLGIIALMLEDNNGNKVPGGEEVGRRFVISAAFVQGIYLCEQSILQGQYVQAGALMRQEFDALATLSEIREKKRKDGLTPNAQYAPWKGARHYGQLSALTHLSDHRVLSPLIGYDTSWGDLASTVPQYKKTIGLRMYSLHTTYVLGIVEELRALYGEMFGYECDQRQIEVIDNAFSILVEHKVFKTPKP